MAALSIPSAARRAAVASTAASSSARIGSPAALSRSGTGKRHCRGTSGTGFSMSMSYCSNRLSVPISMESRKPSVVTSAVRAPVRSISALVASVVPWMTSATSSGAAPQLSIACASPSRTPASGASGVVSTFALIRSGPRSSTISVKVPPISTPIRTAAPASSITLSGLNLRAEFGGKGAPRRGRIGWQAPPLSRCRVFPPAGEYRSRGRGSRACCGAARGSWRRA